MPTLPATRHEDSFPFDALTWEQFEELLLALVRTKHQCEAIMRYGRCGQSQQGIDFFARLPSGRYHCWHAKNKQLNCSDIREAISRFLRGRRSRDTQRFTLCTFDRLDVRTQDAFKQQARRLRRRGIQFEVLSGVDITRDLRNHPTLIETFFHRVWVGGVGAKTADDGGRARRQQDIGQALHALNGGNLRGSDISLALQPGCNARDIREHLVQPNVDAAPPSAELVTRIHSEMASTNASKAAVPRDRRARPNSSGGSAASGGIRFQAAVAACAASSLAASEPLLWLRGLTSDVPETICAETGGPGDDLSIILRSGNRVEAQVKKGLKVDNRLWPTLMKLAHGLSSGQCDFGVLIVCPLSSASIRRKLRDDLVRLGEGRAANLGSAAEEFRRRLRQAGISEQRIAARLRVVTMHCIDGDTASIVTAELLLRSVCADPGQAQAAWSRLYEDATSQMEIRGARTASSIAAVLQSSHILLNIHGSAPVSTLARVSQWAAQSAAQFTVHGIKTPLDLDTAWISTTAAKFDSTTSSIEQISSARASYHAANVSKFDQQLRIPAQTIGWFKPFCVIVAGPGMGKSTLCAVLTRRYSLMGQPVLRLRLRALASRIRHTGSGVEEGIIALGMDGSGLSPREVRDTGLDGWTIICDGLDETAEQQTTICQGLTNIATAWRRCRIIVTTRPIGYRSPLLGRWHHYRLLPINRDKVIPAATFLFNAIQSGGSDDDLHTHLLSEFEHNDRARQAASSPLILSLLVSLASRGQRFGISYTDVYERLFNLFEGDIVDRGALASDISNDTARRFLDILAWTLQSAPSLDCRQTMARCAEALAAELCVPPHAAATITSRCLDHWENHGMVERLCLGTTDALTFVHRSFQEFAAARYLTYFPVQQRPAMLAPHIASEDWTEVVLFSASLGSASQIVTWSLSCSEESHRAQAKRINRCLTVMQIAKLPDALAHQVVEIAIELAASKSWKSHQTYIALGTLAIISPCNLLAVLPKLLRHPDRSLQIIGWMIAATSLEQLTPAVRCQAEQLPIPSWHQLRYATDLWGRPIVGVPNTTAVMHFVSGATELVLRQLPAHPAQALLKQVARYRAHFPPRSIEKVVTRLSDSEHSNSFLDLFESRAPLISELVDSRRQHDVQVLELLVTSLPCTNATSQPTLGDERSTRYLHVAAFLCASGYFHQRQRWLLRQRPITPDSRWTAPLADVFRGTALASGIPFGPLVSEARQLLIEVQQIHSGGRGRWLMEYLPRVDIDVDPRNLSTSDLNTYNLVESLLHPAEYITHMAAQILPLVATENELFQLLPRALQQAKRGGLDSSIKLLSYLPQTNALTIILARLEQPMKYGHEELFNAAANILRQLSEKDRSGIPDPIPAIRNALFGNDPQVALASLTLLQQSYGAKSELSLLVRDALSHWERLNAENQDDSSPKWLAGKARESGSARTLESRRDRALSLMNFMDKRSGRLLPSSQVADEKFNQETFPLRLLLCEACTAPL